MSLARLAQKLDRSARAALVVGMGVLSTPALAAPECQSIEMSASSCTEGEEVELWVEVSDTGGQDLSYAWTQDARLTAEGYGAISEGMASDAVVFVCPGCPPGEDGAAYSVLVQVADSTGSLCFLSADIDFSCDDVGQQPSSDCGCHTRNPGGRQPSVAALLALLAVVSSGLLRRRW